VTTRGNKTLLGCLKIPCPVLVMGWMATLTILASSVGFFVLQIQIQRFASKPVLSCVQACLSAARCFLGLARTLLLLRIAEENPDDRRLNP
jgi:hypothetical protein